MWFILFFSARKVILGKHFQNPVHYLYVFSVFTKDNIIFKIFCSYFSRQQSLFHVLAAYSIYNTVSCVPSHFNLVSLNVLYGNNLHLFLPKKKNQQTFQRPLQVHRNKLFVTYFELTLKHLNYGFYWTD